MSDVTLIPSRRWAPASSSNSTSGHTSTTPSQTASGASSQYILGPSLLGLSLKQCDPSEALGQVWHILDVLEGSPAESAGLVPHGDYVIGWTDGPLYNESEFYELVEEVSVLWPFFSPTLRGASDERQQQQQYQTKY